MGIKILLFFILLATQVVGQNFNEKQRYLLWTFHARNTTIHGVSIGAFPNFSEKERFVITNGIRLEIPGAGFLALLMLNYKSDMSGIDSVGGKFDIKDYGYSETVNGINISTGTLEEDKILYNGLTIAGVVQAGIRINGVAIAGLVNAMSKSNGMQISGLHNEALYSDGVQISLVNSALVMNGLQIGGHNRSHNVKGVQIGVANLSKEVKGVQIGVVNISKKTRGIQIGLLNVNEKRTLPIFNWNFKKTKKPAEPEPVKEEKLND